MFKLMHGAVVCPVKFEISKVRNKSGCKVLLLIISILFESYLFESMQPFSMKTECRKDVHNALHHFFT